MNTVHFLLILPIDVVKEALLLWDRVPHSFGMLQINLTDGKKEIALFEDVLPYPKFNRLKVFLSRYSFKHEFKIGAEGLKINSMTEDYKREHPEFTVQLRGRNV